MRKYVYFDKIFIYFNIFEILRKNLLNWIKSSQFFERSGDKRALGICLMNIGNIHFNCGRYEEALESYESAIIQVNYELGVYSE